MNWLEFIASIIDSLAWPSAFVAVIYFLKEKLAVLFPYVEKVQYKDFAVHFSKSMSELAEESSARILREKERIDEEPGPQELREYLYQLAKLSPRSAVLEAWLNVEAWAKAKLSRQKDIDKEKLSALAPYRLGSLLESEQILNKDDMKIFHSLRELRNQAVHVGEEEFPDDVTDYVSLALVLSASIRKSYHPAHVSNNELP